MIQRIQSLYLLLSTILGVTALSLPLGHFYSQQGERIADIYNLWLTLAENGTHKFTPWALFAILLLVCTFTLMSIFLFKYRALQMRIVTLCMVLTMGYYIYLAFFVYLYSEGCSFTPSISAAFPFVGLILDYLAFRGIMKDEMLIRSLNRLR